MYLLNFNFSVALAVGFIALAGVTVEDRDHQCLTYLNQSYKHYYRPAKNGATTPLRKELLEACDTGSRASSKACE